MKLESIKVDKRVGYRSRKHVGGGKVTDVQAKNTGTWVSIHDNDRNVIVTVRPSQVFANAKAAQAAAV